MIVPASELEERPIIRKEKIESPYKAILRLKMVHILSIVILFVIGVEDTNGGWCSLAIYHAIKPITDKTQVGSSLISSKSVKEVPFRVTYPLAFMVGSLSEESFCCG